MSYRRLWTPEQDQIIINLVKEYGTKKWTSIADQMKKIMNSYSRTSKQIRQRWHNHLDPFVNKKEWSKQQQNILFESHRRFGSRWKQIANKLQGRTDNHVKNYFYSTMRRALRRLNKFLGSKNSTTQMRTIRPSILSFLLDIADQNEEIRSLVSKILEFSKIKPNKPDSYFVFIEDEQKRTFQLAINRLMQINQIYTQMGTRKQFHVSTRPFSDQKIHIKQEQIKEVSQEAGHETIQAQHQSGRLDHENRSKSWQDEQDSYQIMPEIQKPEYEYDFLIKKQQNLEPTNHVQFHYFQQSSNLQFYEQGLLEF